MLDKLDKADRTRLDGPGKGGENSSDAPDGPPGTDPESPRVRPGQQAIVGGPPAVQSPARRDYPLNETEPSIKSSTQIRGHRNIILSRATPHLMIFPIPGGRQQRMEFRSRVRTDRWRII